MRLCILNGSARDGNTTEIVAEACSTEAASLGIPSAALSLRPFMELFTGEYIYIDSGTPAQIAELQKMRDADTLLFVVPTYYRGMPGALKNFFDLVRSPEAYAGKVIAFVSSNHKNQDYGAQQAFNVMQAILIFFKIRAILVPDILIQDPLSPEPEQVRAFLERVRSFSAMRA